MVSSCLYGKLERSPPVEFRPQNKRVISQRFGAGRPPSGFRGDQGSQSRWVAQDCTHADYFLLNFLFYYFIVIITFFSFLKNFSYYFEFATKRFRGHQGSHSRWVAPGPSLDCTHATSFNSKKQNLITICFA